MTKRELLSKIFEFWKNHIYYHDCESIPVLKHFTDDIGNNINECDYYVMKCINIWKISHNSVIRFFPNK